MPKQPEEGKASVDVLTGNRYYIISLKHTFKRDKFITLWRPNNAGYCMNKEMAGVYEELEEGYHNSDGQLPIKYEDAENVFIKDTQYWSKPYFVIPNAKAVWDILGVKMTKDGLIKTNTQTKKQ